MNKPPIRLTLPLALAGHEGRVTELAMQQRPPKIVRHPLSILLALAIVPTGCFNPLVTLETDDAGSDGDTTDGATTDGDTTEAMTTVEPDGGSGDPLPVCGNGVVEGEEVCDDGINDGSYGGCNVDCSAPGPFCGDGVVNGEEPCDDGDDVDGNGCNVDCVVSGTVLWTVTYDGPDHGIDAANGITTDSASNVIVSGSLDLGDEPAGWLRKYTPEGASDWTFEVTGPTGPARNGPVATLLDDDVVFGGNYGPADPSRDAWVWRISAAGEAVWTQTYASPQGGWDIVTTIDVDQDGNLYVLFEESQLPTDPSFRTFVRKYSPEGRELWTQFHDAGVHGHGLAADAQGRFVVTGTQNNGGLDEIWVQQLNSDGAEIWTQTVDAGDASYPTSISVNDEGAIVVVAGPSPRAIRLSADGEQTDTLFPHPEAYLVSVYSVHMDDNANVILGGAIVTRNDTAYGWVTKYDAGGTELWTNTHDGAFDVSLSFDSVLAITTDPGGNVIATGRIHDSANSLSNVWISKYAP